tara:strand:- start:4570 stop:5037 length:468 start_codon:yes stop_codon:yes gene_type:complete
MQPAYRTIYPEGGGFESTNDGGAVALAEHADQAAAREAVELAMTPAPREEITKALAVLRALTKSRAASESDLDFEYGVMEQQLSRYPADVVMAVLRTHADKSPWFPAWAELLPRLDRLTSNRRWMLAQLRPVEKKDVAGIIASMIDDVLGSGDPA